MKLSSSILALASVLAWMPLTSFAQVPAPLAIPPPSASVPAPPPDSPTISPPPGGTNLAEAVGLALVNNVLYLIRDNSATRLDTATIPTGHMMTLDGRIVPLPPGTQFPDGTASPK